MVINVTCDLGNRVWGLNLYLLYILLRSVLDVLSLLLIFDSAILF